MTLGDVIFAYRKSQKMSMERFGELANISKAYVSMLERNRTQRGDEPSPSFEMYRNVAKAIGMDVDELIRQVDGKISIAAETKLPNNVSPMPKMVSRPRLGAIACGEPILAEQNIECYDAVPEWAHCDFTLVCRGDSMIGARILDGDIVCIRQQPEVASGEIAAVMIGDDEATLKRVRLLDNGIALWPENPAYEPKIFVGEEAAKVHILGKATHFISAIR